MPKRRPATLILLASVASVFLNGCYESHEKSGSPKSERVELVTSITELTKVVVETLAEDDTSRFETACVPKLDALRKAIQSKAKPRAGWEREDRIAIEVSLQRMQEEYPQIRERVLKSWAELRQHLQDRNADMGTLKIESFDQKKSDEYGLTTADNVRINVTAGSRKFAILIDHCILIDGKWQIVGELRLAPDATPSTARRKE